MANVALILMSVNRPRHHSRWQLSMAQGSVRSRQVFNILSSLQIVEQFFQVGATLRCSLESVTSRLKQ